MSPIKSEFLIHYHHCVLRISGQNVNSFNDTSNVVTTKDSNYQLARGFKSVCKVSRHGIHFAELLDRVSQVDPEIRIRFTSPHPKDFPDEVRTINRIRNTMAYVFQTRIILC